MNELDKIFKNRLQNREFEFKDSYWQQAEQMIDARVSGGKWKKGIWLLGALLLLGLATFVFWPEPPSIVANQAGKVDELGKQIILKEEAKVQNSVNETAKTSGKQEDFARQSQQEGDASNVLSNYEQKSNDQTLIVNKNDGKIPETTSLKDNDKKLNTQYSQKTIKGRATELINQNAPTSENTETIADQGVDDQDSQQNLLQSNPNTAEESEKNQNLESLISVGENTAKSTFEALETIASKFDFPEAPQERLPNVSKISHPKKQRFSLGITVAGTSHSEKVSEKFFSGFKGGIVGQYHISNALSLSSELLYTYQQNFRIETASSIQTEYGFGLETKIHRQYAERLHFIEIPLYLQWKVRNHIVEGGIAISHLISVHGSIEKYRYQFPWELTITGFKIESTTKSWLSKDQLDPWNAYVLLGYQYVLSPRLTAGFRATYRLNNLTATEEDTSLYQIKPTALQFQVSASWFLFRSL